jgi:hypothetical protein
MTNDDTEFMGHPALCNTYVFASMFNAVERHFMHKFMKAVLAAGARDHTHFHWTKERIPYTARPSLQCAMNRLGARTFFGLGIDELDNAPAVADALGNLARISAENLMGGAL